MRRASLLLAPFRLLAGLAFCVAFLSLLGGGSCVFSSEDDEDCFDDDDDNDEGCDDDDDFDATHGGTPAPSALDIRQRLHELGGGIPVGEGVAAPQQALLELKPGATRLVDYAIELDPRGGHHPVARVVEIDDLSIFEVHAAGMLGCAEFAAFTSAVLADNPELLGLPASAGHLRPRSVHFLDDLVVVVHEQCAGPGCDALAPALPDGEVVFVFDLLGRLLQIENRTTLPPGVVVTLPHPLPRVR